MFKLQSQDLREWGKTVSSSQEGANYIVSLNAVPQCLPYSDKRRQILCWKFPW